jgi:nicotinamidase-related amidase
MERRVPKTDMISPSNAALTLIDGQPAMYQGIESHPSPEVVHNVQVLAKAAGLFGLPRAISTVAKGSLSGPFMPEVTEPFPMHAAIDRTTITSWLDPPFRTAIEATGRRTAVLGGLRTGACVMFPSLDLLAAGDEATSLPMPAATSRRKRMSAPRSGWYGPAPCR